MNERIQILEMLRDGLISADEADKLLRALDINKNEVKTLKNESMKMLKIDVRSAEGDKVNDKVPVNMLKFATSKKLISNIKINGIDKDFLEESIDIEQILMMVESGAIGEIVDIESAKGDVVKIYVE